MDFVVRVRQWNYEVFENLFARKRRVLARLNGVQTALANNPTDFLLEMEHQLISEYSLILMQEEEYWALKSRLNTATFGNCNTTFIHVSMLVRRHRNKIRCIKDVEGNWLMDELEIKDYIRNGFKNLYITKLNMASMTLDVLEFSCYFLEEEDRTRIDGDVSEEEITVGS